MLVHQRVSSTVIQCLELGPFGSIDEVQRHPHLAAARFAKDARVATAAIS